MYIMYKKILLMNTNNIGKKKDETQTCALQNFDKKIITKLYRIKFSE